VFVVSNVIGVVTLGGSAVPNGMSMHHQKGRRASQHVSSFVYPQMCAQGGGLKLLFTCGPGMHGVFWQLDFYFSSFQGYHIIHLHHFSAAFLLSPRNTGLSLLVYYLYVYVYVQLYVCLCMLVSGGKNT